MYILPLLPCVPDLTTEDQEEGSPTGADNIEAEVTPQIIHLQTIFLFNLYLFKLLTVRFSVVFAEESSLIQLDLPPSTKPELQVSPY